MIEVEAKARAGPEIEDRIRELGGEFIGEERHVDIYFNHPSRDFAETDEALRIRKQNNEAFLTYKGPKIDAITKTREELNTPIDDPVVTQLILLQLGFLETFSVKKNRRKYLLDGITLAVDNVDGLGRFLEAEFETIEADYQVHRDRVVTVLGKLGCRELIRKSYLELLLNEL